MRKLAFEKAAVIEAMQKIAAANGTPLTPAVAQDIVLRCQDSPIVLMKWAEAVPAGGAMPSPEEAALVRNYAMNNVFTPYTWDDPAIRSRWNPGFWAVGAVPEGYQQMAMNNPQDYAAIRAMMPADYQMGPEPPTIPWYYPAAGALVGGALGGGLGYAVGGGNPAFPIFGAGWGMLAGGVAGAHLGHRMRGVADYWKERNPYAQAGV